MLCSGSHFSKEQQAVRESSVHYGFVAEFFTTEFQSCPSILLLMMSVCELFKGLLVLHILSFDDPTKSYAYYILTSSSNSRISFNSAQMKPWRRGRLFGLWIAYFFIVLFRQYPRLKWFSSSSTCSPCHPSCESCSGASSTNCLSCRYGSFLWRGVCLPASSDCPAGTFPSVAYHSCRICHRTCATCTARGPQQCTSCSGRRQLNSSSHRCVESRRCPLGHFGSQCAPCHSSCRSCDGPQPTDCTTCGRDMPQCFYRGRCLRCCTKTQLHNCGNCVLGRDLCQSVGILDTTFLHVRNLHGPDSSQNLAGLVVFAVFGLDRRLSGSFCGAANAQPSTIVLAAVLPARAIAL